MSNFLAVAAVTEILRQILEAAISRDVSGGARATSVRPSSADKSSISGLPEIGVNIFLYQISFNAERRNSDLPNRRSDGSLMQRPRAALDLNYLLTFYGDEKRLEPQRVLGSVISALHSRPALTRSQIRTALEADDNLRFSDLAEEPELVRLTPLPLNIEEMHNLWSGFFQSPYLLSVAYQASVVFIEGKETPQESLPVQKFSITAGVFREPFIEQVSLPEGLPKMQPILQDSWLVIRGRNLKGQITQVKIGQMLIVPSEAEDDCIKICLSDPPFAPGSLRAGINSIQVIHIAMLGDPPTPHSGFESNAIAFVLRPTIVSIKLSKNRVNASGRLSGELVLQIKPQIGNGQKAVLFLNDVDKSEGEAYVFRAFKRTGDADIVLFSFEGVKPGAYSVRVQVDGAESPLLLDEDGESSYQGLYVKPKIVIGLPSGTQ
jgi:hypothetical protein